MDIFIISINNADNVSFEILKQFQKRQISDKKKFTEHCFSYLMLDDILKNVYGIAERQILFINKKPFLKNKKKFVSISHSGDYIALGFSDYDCGIDIEKNKHRKFQDIAKRLNFNCQNSEEFYCEWTKYEAEYKLGQVSQSSEVFRFKNYTVYAASVNKNEKFELFIQTKNTFSKVSI